MKPSSISALAALGDTSHAKASSKIIGQHRKDEDHKARRVEDPKNK